jgi:hypothetical protein
VDQKARHLSGGGDGLDHALGGPAGGGMLGDADSGADDTSAKDDDLLA